MRMPLARNVKYVLAASSSRENYAADLRACSGGHVV